jgi:hypothetical protein
MKNKLFITLTLILVAAAAIWLWRPRSASVAKLRAPVQASRITTAPPARVIPNQVNMVTVAVRPRQQRNFYNPARDAWSDVEIIADDNAEYQARLEAIKHLPRTLTQADWKALKAFLLKPDSEDEGQLNQVVKNELMDSLCEMTPPPDGLGNVMGQTFGNLLQNEVIRDYAVQHLATLDETLAANGGPGVAKEEQTGQQVLWNALSETGDSIAGTALLGLVRLSQQPNANVDTSQLDAAALDLANDSTAGELAKITAYQVCAQLNVQGALPQVEAAAQNSQDVSVQISAIGSLGLLGGSKDISLLQNLLAGDEKGRLELPIQTAITRIETREN